MVIWSQCESIKRRLLYMHLLFFDRYMSFIISQNEGSTYSFKSIIYQWSKALNSYNNAFFFFFLNFSECILVPTGLDGGRPWKVLSRRENQGKKNQNCWFVTDFEYYHLSLDVFHACTFLNIVVRPVTKPRLSSVQPQCIFYVNMKFFNVF